MPARTPRCAEIRHGGKAISEIWPCIPHGTGAVHLIAVMRPDVAVHFGIA